MSLVMFCVLWVTFSVLGTFFTWVFRAKGAGYALGAVVTAFLWLVNFIWTHPWPF